MRRREFIAGLGGAVAWPLGARAQQRGGMRRVGILSALVENDAEGQARFAAFRQSLVVLGWVDGRNLQVDIQWGAVDSEHARSLAAELLSLAPD